MKYERIALDRGARGVATLTLNRPDRGNAYDDVMLRELMIALAELDNDDAVRVVLLRGAEWSCADAAHDLGADRLADKDLDDLANGLELLASTIRRYRQTRQPETAHNPGRNP